MQKNIGVVAFLSRPCPNLAKAKYQVAYDDNDQGTPIHPPIQVKGDCKPKKLLKAIKRVYGNKSSFKYLRVNQYNNSTSQ